MSGRKKIDNRVGQPDIRMIPNHILPGRMPGEVMQLMIYDYAIDRQGLPQVLKAVADYYNDNIFPPPQSGQASFPQLHIEPGQVLMADGARSAASVIAVYLMNQCRDRGVFHPRALLIKPGYSLYNAQFKGLGYKVDSVTVPLSASDGERLEAIRKAIKPDTIILPLTNPNNPTGEIYSAAFLQGLLKILDENPQLNIINDAVYDQILRKGIAKPASIMTLANPQQRKRVFEVDCLAKSFAYPAIRAGWAIGDAEVMGAIQEGKDPMHGPLNNIAQLVVISALSFTPRLRPAYHEEVNAIYDRRLNYVHEKLSQIEGFKSQVPPATFYYWADFSGVIPAQELIAELAKRDILVSNGKNFGDENCIRLNCGATAEVLGMICDEIVNICRERGVKINEREISPVPKILDEVSFGINPEAA